jgi:hypothetical protein
MTYHINSNTKLKVNDILEEIANTTYLCGPSETQCEPLEPDMQLRTILTLPEANDFKVSFLRP